MKKFGLWALAASLLSPMLGAQQVDVREETLANGMRLLMVERRESPTIATAWVARVGSVNERPGITGISHLFEHMMFKGTRTIGTRDPQRGAEIRRRQDAVRAEMEKEYSLLRTGKRRGEVTGNIYAPENQTRRLKELRGQLEQLFAEERDVIVKDELDQIYTREGGAGLNAFTNQDMTGYFVMIPSNRLELWFWLESDRLLNPVFREFYSERDVVREERRMRTESTPTGKLNELFNAMFWQASPYSWPVVGWPSDVESITRDQAEAYFDIFYAPNNLTAILVGDFDSDEALTLARRYFGRIARGDKEPPEVITEEVEQIAQKRFSAEAATNPQVSIRFHTVPFRHQDQAALDVMASVLRGRTGRLYQALVEEQDLVVGSPSAGHLNLKHGGFFSLSAQVKPGRDPGQVEAALLAEVERLGSELVSDRELQKVKNQDLANSFRALGSAQGIMQQLLFAEGLGDWKAINEDSGRLQAVTPADVQRVAGEYFGADKRNIAIYTRKADAAPEDPEVSTLPEQAQAFVRQFLSRLESATPAEVEQAVTNIRQNMEQAPAEMQRALEVLLKRLEEKLKQVKPGEGA